MNQNSKKGKEKKLTATSVGKRFKLHGFTRKKQSLKKLGGRKQPSPTVQVSIPIKNRSIRLPRGHLPRRHHTGPMTDHLRTLYGDRTEVTSYFGGRVDYLYQRVPYSYDWLSNVVTSSGDHRHPTGQAFTHRVYSDYSGLQISTTISNGTTTITDQFSGVGLFPNTNFNFPGIGNSNAYNQALSRLYDKLRGDIDLSVDLAESHKTKTMMRDTIRSMASLATTFRKMRRANPRDWGNLWLEYTYGWKPLVSSIYGAGKKLMTGGPKGPGFLHVTASASEQMLNGTTRDIRDFGNVSSSYRIRRFYLTGRCRFDCVYQVNNSELVALGGFTSLNPVSIAWELTPYSFVVDWFINFGGYLRNFESALLYRTSFLQGYSTQTSLGECWSSLVGTQVTASGGTVFTTSNDMKGTERFTEKRRTVLTLTPFPRPPRFDPHLGASRLISGASLLGQMLTSLEHTKSYGDPRPQDTLADQARKRAAGRSFERASKEFNDWEREIRRKNPLKR